LLDGFLGVPEPDDRPDREAEQDRAEQSLDREQPHNDGLAQRLAA
jgi:hypothetical protein